MDLGHDFTEDHFWVVKKRMMELVAEEGARKNINAAQFMGGFMNIVAEILSVTAPNEKAISVVFDTAKMVCLKMFKEDRKS